MQQEDSYVNFSTPQRTQSLRSLSLPRRRSVQEATPKNLKRSESHGRSYVRSKFVPGSFDIKTLVPAGSYTQPSGGQPTKSGGISVALFTKRVFPSKAKDSTVVDTRPELAKPPTLISTPWEVLRQKGIPTRRSSRYKTGRVPELPLEVNHCILRHLEASYSSTLGTDVSGLQANLRALCLVSKQWSSLARIALYRDLWLPSARSFRKRKWSLNPSSSRLRQLRDALQSSPELASQVRWVRPTHALAVELCFESVKELKKGSKAALLEEVISLCPGLEYLGGFPAEWYDPARSLADVLTRATHLRSHSWLLDYGNLSLSDPNSLVDMHNNWSRLQSFTLSVSPGLILGSGVVLEILSRLPSLRHLVLAGIDRHDLPNDHLRLLPALTSLRLENIDGITDRGAAQLALSPMAFTLEKLLLVDLELVDLKTFQTLFSRLTNLRRFALVQNTTPIPTIGLRSTGWDRSLQSMTLQELHWDCVIPGSAISRIAVGIERGSFPSLRRVTIPCDHDGLIQNLCRPIARKKITPADRQFLDSHKDARYERSLRLSRLQAQARIQQSQQRPMFSVVVADESTGEEQVHTIGSYLGRVESRIEYCLEAEIGENALTTLHDVYYTPGRGAYGGYERSIGMEWLL